MSRPVLGRLMFTMFVSQYPLTAWMSRSEG
uniref:Uncharacterized protein n=1 Tax=Anguilla anguilla TaxID=7936 RepID=A0A0E9V980_ANGAN